MKIFSNPEYLIKLLPFPGSCNALSLGPCWPITSLGNSSYSWPAQACGRKATNSDWYVVSHSGPSGPSRSLKITLHILEPQSTSQQKAKGH